MKDKLLFALIICMLMYTGACTKQSAESPVKDNKTGSIHRAAPAKEGEVGYVPVLKKQKLANYQAATIGDAFDSYKYFGKREWRERKATDGSTYIDFIGWFDTGKLDENASKSGITGRGVDVMFVIDRNGSYYVFMVSKVESRSDGNIMAYKVGDGAGVIANIYANKQINL